ncbi:MAG: hypothetical protein ABJL44_11770 [Algibacter sp.]
MKKILIFGITLLLVMLFFSCDTKDKIDIPFDNEVIGKWKLFESYISSGGPQYLVDVENGEEFVFFQDGSFSSDRFSDCTDGDFLIQSENLILKYDCDGVNIGSENSNGEITYNVTFESDFLILIPTSVICIEGCSYRYKRI